MYLQGRRATGCDWLELYTVFSQVMTLPKYIDPKVVERLTAKHWGSIILDEGQYGAWNHEEGALLYLR